MLERRGLGTGLGGEGRGRKGKEGEGRGRKGKDEHLLEF